MKEYQAQRTLRPQSFLWVKKKCRSFSGCEVLFAFRSSGIEDQRMNEGEAEVAEIVP
jgi:hypothetical protein